MRSRWGYETKEAIREIQKAFHKEDTELMLWKHKTNEKICRFCVLKNVRRILKEARTDSFAPYYEAGPCDCCGEDASITWHPDWAIEY